MRDPGVVPTFGGLITENQCVIVSQHAKLAKSGYGPWLKHGAVCVALPEDEDVPAVGLNRAVMRVDTA